jgi:hypothetical protein
MTIDNKRTTFATRNGGMKMTTTVGNEREGVMTIDNLFDEVRPSKLRVMYRAVRLHYRSAVTGIRNREDVDPALKVRLDAARQQFEDVCVDTVGGVDYETLLRTMRLLQPMIRHSVADDMRLGAPVEKEEATNIGRVFLEYLQQYVAAGAPYVNKRRRAVRIPA